ncbi:hypothetical protein [Shouchella shacheensis]|uniref:hypothetical protein n=1 Tax=Shouchella shacheensis TaxID=1649580 RepID=UPI00074013B5|nr:hypothetical protein [Shouchella shacheensis]
MSDDTLGVLIGGALVLFVYGGLHWFLKGKYGRAGFHPDWITPVALVVLPFVLAFFAGAILENPMLMMLPILLSFGVVPLCAFLTLAKWIVLALRKKNADA